MTGVQTCALPIFVGADQISVWFAMWLDVTSIDILHHLVRFKKTILLQHEEIAIKILNDIFNTEPELMRKCYEDHPTLYNVFNKAEKAIYKELGIDPIKWKNQELLLSLFNKKFKTVKAEYSPAWLRPQRFDIYVPAKKTAIEYQGAQHFEPIEFFGGEAGLVQCQIRDEKKRNLSQENDVKLLYWHHSIAVTAENFERFISDNFL